MPTTTPAAAPDPWDGLHCPVDGGKTWNCYVLAGYGPSGQVNYVPSDSATCTHYACASCGLVLVRLRT